MSAMRPPAERQVTPSEALEHLSCVRPDLAHGPAIPVGEGWDCQAFRIGDILCRFPRRAIGKECVENELQWLAPVAEGLTIPTSAALFTGTFDGWPWVASRYIPGETALGAQLNGPAFAEDLAAFFNELHQPAPMGAPLNQFRSCELIQRRDKVLAFDPSPELLDRFDACAAIPPHQNERVWVHGDVHPLNVIVADGRLAGIIDWGDMFGGDPAMDLCAAWMFLEETDRTTFRRAVGADDALWGRALGWAIFFGSVYQDTELADTGALMLQRVLSDG